MTLACQWITNIRIETRTIPTITVSGCDCFAIFWTCSCANMLAPGEPSFAIDRPHPRINVTHLLEAPDLGLQLL